MYSLRRLIAFLFLLPAVGLRAEPGPTEGPLVEARIEALTGQVQALTDKIVRMEKSFAERVDALEKRLDDAAKPAAAVPAEDLEEPAKAAYRDIVNLTAVGDFASARERMTAFMAAYEGTAVAKRARRVQAELKVIDRPVPRVWRIDRWLQGEGEIDFDSEKPIVLVFFEVWCNYCKREAPKIQKLHMSEIGSDVQILGMTTMSRGSTEEQVLEFMAEKGLSFPVAKEDGNLSRYFNVSGVPAAAVVKDGKVVWRGHPTRLSDLALKRYL